MEDKVDMDKSELSPPNKTQFVNYVALIIIILSAGILIVLISVASMNLKSVDDKPNPSFVNIKELFTILLPLIGTWMGTILAFYFSKENFKAANQSLERMVKQITTTDEKLQELKVSDVMIKLDTSMLMMVKDEDDFMTRKLSELLDKLENSRSERMPILQDGTLKFIFLIYRTTIDRFLLGVFKGSITSTEQGNLNFTTSRQDLTVADMFHSNFQLIKEIENCKGCFMPITATLDQVKQAMQDNSICQDVFITKTGNKEEAVEGWITNNLVIEKAELFKKSGARA